MERHSRDCLRGTSTKRKACKINMIADLRGVCQKWQALVFCEGLCKILGMPYPVYVFLGMLSWVCFPVFIFLCIFSCVCFPS